MSCCMLASFFETDVGNSVVLVMPTTALVDTVILSQPIPAPHPPSPFVDLSLSGGWGIPAYSPEPQVTSTTPSNTSPARPATASPTTCLGS